MTKNEVIRMLKTILRAIFCKTNEEIFEEKEQLVTKFIQEHYGNCFIQVEPLFKQIRKLHIGGVTNPYVCFFCKINHPKVKLIYINSMIGNNMISHFKENPIPDYILEMTGVDKLLHCTYQREKQQWSFKVKTME